MKRGFTLLELVVVIIIIGILATLGLTQYGRVIERSRGAEARAILGDVRKYAIAYRLEHGTITGFTLADLGIGDPFTDPDMIPSNCTQVSHYFSYNATSLGDPGIDVVATRCTGAVGKPPGAAVANTLTLTSNLATGQDTWVSPAGY